MGNSTAAKYYGSYVYSYPGKVSSFCQDQQISQIKIMSCRILHGSYSWLATLGANTLTLGTNDPIQHWWLHIETDAAFYTVQKWTSGVIGMYRTASEWEANQCGLTCAGKASDSAVFTEKYHFVKQPFKTIKWFTQILSQMKIGAYDILSCNCQDFAYRAYKTIYSGFECNQLRVGTYPWLIPIVGIVFYKSKKKKL